MTTILFKIFTVVDLKICSKNMTEAYNYFCSNNYPNIYNLFYSLIKEII